MREAELAALSDEFFEPEFNQGSATLIGSPVNTEELGGRTITFLRPDARTLARAEVYTVPPPEGDDQPFVEDIVLVLRGARIYSRATLEELFGTRGKKTQGPPSEDGDPSEQIEFAQDRTLRGMVIVRWWPDADDPEAHGEVYGPDEVRVEELHLRRFLPGMDQTHGQTIPPGEADLIDDDEVVEEVPDPVEPEVDLDEAMDTGAWVADLAWRILRPDFDLARAFELLGSGEADPAAYDQRVVLRPRDPRLELAIVTAHANRVKSVRLDMPEHAALAVALDAVTDRLNSLPTSINGTLHYKFESTRSRGAVTLVLGRGAQRGPLVRITAMEVTRG